MNYGHIPAKFQENLMKSRVKKIKIINFLIQWEILIIIMMILKTKKNSTL